MTNMISALNISDWITVIFSTVALILSLSNFYRSQVAARAQVFIEFRRKFIGIKENLPSWYAEKNIAKCPPYKYDSSDWRPIEVYWQHSFDEWFISQKLDEKVLGRLWRLFYRDAIGNALKIIPLRFAISKISHSQTEFGAYSKEFREVLDSVWKNSEPDKHINICDGFDCSYCHPFQQSDSKPSKSLRNRKSK